MLDLRSTLISALALPPRFCKTIGHEKTGWVAAVKRPFEAVPVAHPIGAALESTPGVADIQVEDSPGTLTTSLPISRSSR